MSMTPHLCGVILAGGKATRMNQQPKGLLQLNNRLLLDHVIDKAKPQVNQLLLNSNEALPAYQQTGLPLLADTLSGHLGPLAGILTAMEWSQKHQPACQWLASFAVDTPFFPNNLVEQLLHIAETDEKSEEVDIVCPTYLGRRQPTFCLWRISQADALRRALTEQKLYRVGGWLKQRQTRELAFHPVANHLPEPFFNINTPEELTLAQGLQNKMSLNHD